MKLKKVLLLCGVPGSGKSTWAKQFINEHPRSVRISRDDIRFTFIKESTDYFAHEDEVFDNFIKAINFAIGDNATDTIIIDATHISVQSRAKVLNKIDLCNCEVIAVNFKVSKEVCLDRNSQRSGFALVPDKVIRRMWFQFVPASINEMFIDKVKNIYENGELGMIYLTSDLHFGHDREFVWNARGYASVEDMNQKQVEKWNSTVSANDDVYVLGDLMLGAVDNIKYIEQLEGKLHIVFGNHDTMIRQKMYTELPNVVECGWAFMLNYRKYHFYMSHFPTMTGNLEKESLHQMTLNLYGHTHQKTNFYEDIPYMYHVGVDSHNGYPVLLDEVIDDMKAKVEECKTFLK